MLKWLHIRNLALIPDADVEFAVGFNAVTGETGAGKSVFMSGLELLLGGRFDKSSVRTGETRCEISGEFAIGPESASAVAELLDSAGIEPCSDSALLARRVFTPSGARNFVNGSPANAKLLSSLGAILADIHASGETHGLLDVSEQAAALDRFAGNSALLEDCRAAWTFFRNASAEKQRFLESMPSPEEAERLRAEIDEIEKVDPKPAEDSELESRHSAAANSRDILETAQKAVSALTDSEDSLDDRISALKRDFDALERVDPVFAESAAAKCGALHDAVTELSRAVSDHASAVELDPAEFAALEDRMTALQNLKRRFGPSLEEVFRHLSDSKNRLDSFENSSRRREELESAEDRARAAHRTLCMNLSGKRRAAADDLSAKLAEELAKLGLPHAAFGMEFSDSEPGPGGADRIEFLFSANPGVPRQPLRAVASSGEMSRVMLALKTVLADADRIPTMVFDEIDANIGGETAVAVADELALLAKSKQIISISHLAQVASKAGHHIVVEKTTDGSSSRSLIRVVTGRARTAEIARMLGGGKAAEKHASALLSGK